MTLTYEFELDIFKMCLRTKYEVSCRGFQSLENEQHKQTHTQMQPNAL